MLSVSEIRLFNGLNLSMTLISSGGFLPTNSLNLIVNNNLHKIVLIVSFFISIFNIFFIYNSFNNKNILIDHYEDFTLIILSLVFSLILFFSINDLSFFSILLNVLSSLGTSGLTINNVPGEFSLYLLFLTIIGGSIISNTSGIKFLRIYILLKASFEEILKLVKPNNIVSHKILFSNQKINTDNIRLSFLIFISFFISIFVLSGILLLDSLNFENSFKLSILTLTNTTNSELYGLSTIDFKNLLTSSKIFIIIFMIIGKIELLSFFLIIKQIFYKN